jgi:hypothetical protein
MRQSVEMHSGAMIHIQIFMKTGSDIENLMGGCTDTQTRRQKGHLISLLLFFLNEI